MGLVGLQHNKTSIGFGHGGWHQQHKRTSGPRAGLGAQPAPQAIVNLVDMIQLVGHGSARDIQHTAGDYPAYFTGTMHIYGLYSFSPAHFLPFVLWLWLAVVGADYTHKFKIS
jgi:hypothetical protein